MCKNLEIYRCIDYYLPVNTFSIIQNVNFLNNTLSNFQCKKILEHVQYLILQEIKHILT